MIESLKTVTRGLCDFFGCDNAIYGLGRFVNEDLGIKFKVPRECSIQRKIDATGRYYEVVSNYSDEFLVGFIECLEEVSLQKIVHKHIESIKKKENYNTFETVSRTLTEYSKAGYSEYREEITYNVYSERFRQTFFARTVPYLPNTIYFFSQCLYDPRRKRRGQKRHLTKTQAMGRKIYKSIRIEVPEKKKGFVTLVNDTMKINLPHPCFKTQRKTDGFVCHYGDKVIDVSDCKGKQKKKEEEELMAENVEKEIKKKEEEEEEGEGEEEEERVGEEKEVVESEEEEIKSEPEEEEETEKKEVEPPKKQEEEEEEEEEEERKETTLYEEELNYAKKKLIINEELNQLLLKGNDGRDVVRIQTVGFEAKQFAKNIKVLSEKEAALRSGKSPFCVYRYRDQHVNLKLTYPYYMFVQKEFFTRDNDPLVVINSERSMLTKISVRHFNFHLTRNLGTRSNRGNSSPGSDNGVAISKEDDFYMRNISVEHNLFEWAERVKSFPLCQLMKKLPESKRRFKFVYRYYGARNGSSNMVTFLVLKDMMTVIRIHSMNHDNGQFREKPFNVFRMIHSMVECSLN